MAPYIVIVEDDHLQEDALREHLEGAFSGARVRSFGTEHDFRSHLSELHDDPPDVVVMDVMLRWTYPAPDAPPRPADVAAGEYYRAGLRCAELLLAEPGLARVPVLLFTILERDDLERDGGRLPANSSYVGKVSDLGVLSRTVRQKLQRPAGRS